MTARLADFVARTRFEALPQGVVEETKRVLLDSLGCALGGNTVPKGKGAIDFARDLGGKAEDKEKIWGENAARLLGIGK